MIPLVWNTLFRHLVQEKALLALIVLCLYFPVQAADSAAMGVFKDTLRIASEPDYPPYCIVNAQGEADGFSVDLIKAAARASRMEVQISIGLWHHIKAALAEGKLDALPLVGRTPERNEIFDFSMPYLTLQGTAFIRKAAKQPKTLDELRGMDVLVMEGDNAEEFVRREGFTGKIIITHTFEEAFLRLSGGEADAVIAQQIMGLKLLEQLNIQNVTSLDFEEPLFRQEFCFAVTKGNQAVLDRLNEGLSIVIATDEYAAIRNKWFGPPEQSLSAMEQGKRLFPYIIALFILWAIASNYYLRWQGRKHTRQLREEVEEHKQTLKQLQVQEQMAREKGEEIRLLLDSTAEGIFGLDTEGHCTFINRAARQLLGLASEEDVRGKQIHRIVHHTKTDGSAHREEDCKILSALSLQSGTYSENDVFWTSQGHPFPVEFYSYPVLKEGEVSGVVVAFLDITERKKAEEALQDIRKKLEEEVAVRTLELKEKVAKLDKSQRAMLFMVEDLNKITAELKVERKKLEISNKELEAFTYSVSHDLRAPLRAINGYAKFLLEDYAGKLDEEGKRFIDTICQNAEKMDLLISDMLNLSRVSRTEMKYFEVDMEGLIRAVYAEVATPEEQKEFKMIIHPLPKVFCDHNLMKQVWHNLLGNALKYSSKSEKKEIVVEGRTEDGKAVFSIRDSGCGFDPKYTHKLFGVFQRLHRSEEYEGTGVGLAIVERIIRRHQGEVWAEGKPGLGAAFYFSLPIQRKGFR